MKRSRRLVLAFAGMAAIAMLAVPTALASNGKPPHRKVTICHHTGSKTNPAVMINVAYAALPAHKRHGDFKPTYTDKKHPACIPPKNDRPANGKPDGKPDIKDTIPDKAAHGTVPAPKKPAETGSDRNASEKATGQK